MKNLSLIMLVLACALHLACGTEDDGTTMMNDGGNAVAMGGAGGDDAMGGAGGDDAMGGAGGDDAMGGAGGDDAMGGAGGDDAMGGAGGDDPVETVTTAMIQTLFDAPCGVCHNATFPMLNDLEGWANLASNQSDLLIVVPGDHQNSYLYHKVAGTHMDAPANGSGLIMPMGGIPFTADQVALVAAWIDGLSE